MLKEFINYISENRMLKNSDKVLLAVSGGIDSMVMTDLFLKAGYRTGIAHCNFSLRGKDSDMDEELVRKIAEKNNLSFYSVKFNTKEFAKKNTLSIQVAARQLRYNWFEQIRLDQGYDVIAVAHNRNDNIETLLINLVRGTGISGLTGMQPVSNKVIRPLLFASRNDIEKYSNKNKIVFREDRSNADTKYLRNKIRHIVIPVLKEINPALENTLSETIIRLKETDELVIKYISEIRANLIEYEDINSVFDIEKLEKFISEKSTLFELFHPFGLSGSQYADLVNVISGKTGGQLFTSSHRILKNRNKLIVSPIERETDSQYIIRNMEEWENIPIIDSVYSREIKKGFIIPDDKMTACLDESSVEYPLIIRRWKKGDYFYPLGMKNRKKISDFLIDNKKSLIDKEKIKVLESGGRIAWVIGERIDSRFRIRASSKKALIIESKS